MAVRANPDIKRYIAPLLERRRDLVLIGRRLVMTPVTHYARCVYFDRSRWQGSLIPHALVLPLYERLPDEPGLEGFELKRDHKAWDLREEGGEAELCNALEARALPLIEHVLTPDDYLEYLRGISPKWVMRIMGETFVDLIKGNFSRAEAGLVDRIARSKPLPGVDEPEPLIPPPGSYRYMLDRLREDPWALLRTMHEWEAGQVKLLKVERYWQPSPFPCEERAPQ